MTAIRILVVLLAVVLLLPHGLPAATLHVGTGQTYTTIQSAVSAAGSGDQIVVHDGTYVENVTVTTPVSIVSKDFLDNGENDGAIIDAGSNYLSAISVYSVSASVEGFSMKGIAFGAYGVYVATSDACRIANNRFGWDDNWVFSGVWLYQSTHCVIEDNEFGPADNSGIYMDQSSDNEVSQNSFHDINGNPGYAVWMSGLWDVGGSNCQRNYVEFNEFTICDVGVYASGTVWHNVIRGNHAYDCASGIFLGKGGVWHTMVDANTLESNIMNIVLDGGSFNAIIDNTLDGGGTGIRIGFSAPYAGNYNSIAFNSIWNHVLGMYVGAAAEGNRMAMNSFVGNTVNIESHGTDWNSPTPLSYFYGPNRHNYLGNYYDTYTGTDTDGDGIGDTGLPFNDGEPTTGPVENYPLISPPDQYAIEAWYLQPDSPLTMFHRDMTRPVMPMDIGASEQHVWLSDTPAAANIDYASAPWSGCVTFEAPPGSGEFTLEIGSSPGGTTFNASGVQASIGGASEIAFETNAGAVSVPEGHYLAVRLTNNTEWSHRLILGGFSSYISSPGNDDPEWPGEVTDVEGVTPASMALRQNYPNPFNPSTTIAFSVPQRTAATLRVYDVRGQYVATLLSKTIGPGWQSVRWDGRDHRGNPSGSGVYFYRLEAGARSVARKMVLLR